MSKFTCLALCAVAVSLSSVYAAEEEKCNFREAIRPLALECAKEYEISEADFMKAKAEHSPDSLNPCFVGCVLKKFEIINDKGEYDMDANIAKMKKLAKNDEIFTKLSGMAKECESVNTEEVSDGDAGCERAVLLTKCFIAHKSEIL